MPKLGLTRDQLAEFLPDHQSIRAFEQVLNDVGTTLPDTIEEANNNASIAVAAANAAIAAFVELASQVSALLCAPPQPEIVDPDDYAPRFALIPENDDLLPRFELGTISSQNADNVEITGGTISGITLTGSSGAFTTISATGQITSTLATGTAPLVIASTTKVNNLNADLLDGADWAAPASIGSTTPNSATFTSVTYSGQLTSTVATGTAPMVVASTTKVANLNADLLDGNDWAAPAALGSTTPNSAAVTTLTASGQITSTVATGTPPFVVASFTNVPALNCSLLLGFNWVTPGTIGSTTANTIRGTTITATIGMTTTGGAQFLTTSTALTNGAGAGAGTITNAPAAGNPTKWIGINDNGTIRYIPSW